MLASSVFADTLTVCGGGECNSTTIQGAINLASPSDTINVTAGTYQNYDVSVKNTGSGTYTLSISGIPGAWYTVSSSVAIAAGVAATMTYTLQLPADASNTTFTVKATVPTAISTSSDSYSVSLQVTHVNVTQNATVRNVTQIVTTPLLPAVANRVTGLATAAISNSTNQMIIGAVVGMLVIVVAIRLFNANRKPWKTYTGYSYNQGVVKSLKKQIKSVMEEE